jgi:hypothetical protein
MRLRSQCNMPPSVRAHAMVLQMFSHYSTHYQRGMNAIWGILLIVFREPVSSFIGLYSSLNPAT